MFKKGLLIINLSIFIIAIVLFKSTSPAYAETQRTQFSPPARTTTFSRPTSTQTTGYSPPRRTSTQTSRPTSSPSRPVSRQTTPRSRDEAPVGQTPGQPATPQPITIPIAKNNAWHNPEALKANGKTTGQLITEHIDSVVQSRTDLRIARSGQLVIPDEGIKFLYANDMVEYIVKPTVENGQPGYSIAPSRLNIEGQLRGPGDTYKKAINEMAAVMRVDSSFASVVAEVFAPSGATVFAADGPKNGTLLKEITTLQMTKDTSILLSWAALKPNDPAAQNKPYSDILFRFNPITDDSGRITWLQRTVTNENLEMIIGAAGERMRYTIQKTATGDFGGMDIAFEDPLDIEQFHAFGQEEYAVNIPSMKGIARAWRKGVMGENGTFSITSTRIEVWTWPHNEAKLNELIAQARAGSLQAVKMQKVDGNTFHLYDGTQQILRLNNPSPGTIRFELQDGRTLPAATIPTGGAQPTPSSQGFWMPQLRNWQGPNNPYFNQMAPYLKFIEKMRRAENQA